jgi:uncharacterized PurR-regulated membrane protein YhhQ (DUF165 family)
MKSGLIYYSLAMIFAVVISNILVEMPINNWLTWGAFSYPLTFLVTELTNYYYGSRSARRVVYIGFVVAFFLSLMLANAQIACASALAFLVGQLLDISVFVRLRRKTWWLAPLAASFLGSFVDTVIFFSIAFWGQGLLILTLGAGDLGLKLLMDLVMLLPFRIFLWNRPRALYV